MPAELSLAGTGFLVVPAPGPGSGPLSETLRLETSRPSEETLVLRLGPHVPGGRPVSLASIDLATVTVEPAGGEAGTALGVERARGEGDALPPGAPPFELEPGDTVLVAGASYALRYTPWEEEDSGGFRAWFRADAAEAARVRDAFAKFCDSLEIPGPVVSDVSLALQEALDNVVEHAYRERPRGVVLVEARLDPGSRVVVSVRDRGPAFDPASAPPPDPAAWLEAGRIGGLGVHLVKNLVDTLSYERQNGENRLTLTRRLAAT